MFFALEELQRNWRDKNIYIPVTVRCMIMCLLLLQDSVIRSPVTFLVLYSFVVPTTLPKSYFLMPLIDELHLTGS